MRYDPENTETSSSVSLDAEKKDILSKITEDKVIITKIIEGFENALSITLSEEEKELFEDYWKERRL